MSSDTASVPRVTAADLHLRDAVVQELEVRDVKHVVNRISVARAAPDLNRLLTALTRNAAVPEGAISVEVSDGVVTLTGEVPSWRAREAAERAVARGPGVGQVDNRITVGDDGLTKVRVPVVRPQ